MKAPITEKEKEIIRALQKDFPIVPEPYKELANALNMTEEDLLDTVRSLSERGCLKRISIALHHNNVGYVVNVMVVWDIPDEQAGEVGRLMSMHPAVTHCYTRSRKPDFPYNLYTMVHCASEEEYDVIIRELLQITEKILPHPVSFDGLRTISELKKAGMMYFCERPDEIVE